MTIKVGDRLPEGQLQEFIDVETEGCPLGPNTFSVGEISKGKKIAIFGLPGAFTPTCSAKHVPGYVEEIWCLSVNDAFVMGAWGRDQKVSGKVRMMADGAAEFTKKLGLEFDVPNLGVRCRRFSMLVDNGVVKSLNIEEPKQFAVSDAATMLKQLG
jgi:peroxiredoxin